LGKNPTIPENKKMPEVFEWVMNALEGVPFFSDHTEFWVLALQQYHVFFRIYLEIFQLRRVG
jgi:transposase-like protein